CGAWNQRPHARHGCAWGPDSRQVPGQPTEPRSPWAPERHFRRRFLYWRCNWFGSFEHSLVDWWGGCDLRWWCSCEPDRVYDPEMTRTAPPASAPIISTPRQGTFTETRFQPWSRRLCRGGARWSLDQARNDRAA